MFKNGKGAAILVDYGFPAHEYYFDERSSGTLMCHYRHHAHPDPFFLPGLQDITAHVDFTAMALAAQDAGLDVLGYMNQASFLLAAGIGELLLRTDPEDALRYLPQSKAVQKLVSPAEMGELFKVLVVGKGWSCPAIVRADRSHRLVKSDNLRAGYKPGYAVPSLRSDSMAKIHTHYDNLKVSRHAPQEVIRAAYKALSQKYHPDKNPGDERPPASWRSSIPPTTSCPTRSAARSTTSGSRPRSGKSSGWKAPGDEGRQRARREAAGSRATAAPSRWRFLLAPRWWAACWPALPPAWC
jgi:hypothetical protein